MDKVGLQRQQQTAQLSPQLLKYFGADARVVLQLVNGAGEYLDAVDSLLGGHWG